MSNVTFTTVNGKVNAVIINDKDGKPYGFVNFFPDGKYGEKGGLKFKDYIFAMDDDKVCFAKEVTKAKSKKDKDKVFVHAVKTGTKANGEDYKLEIFIEDELFQLVKVDWQENASLAACVDAENELDSLYKAVKAKKGWVWDAFVGKTDKARKAELANWLKDEQFSKEIHEDYPAESAAPRRPTTPKRPTK